MKCQFELSVGQCAIAFHVVIVANPVATSNVADGCEEVCHLVYVNELLELLVGVRRRASLSKTLPAVEGVLRSRHLEITIRILEGIHLVVVIAVIGVAVIAIVWFAKVELSQIASIEENVNGLIILTIAIEAARHKNLLGEGVTNSAMSLRVVVVSAISNHDLAVLVVRLVTEEGIVVDGLLALVAIGSLNLEGRGSVVATPAS